MSTADMALWVAAGTGLVAVLIALLGYRSNQSSASLEHITKAVDEKIASAILRFQVTLSEEFRKLALEIQTQSLHRINTEKALLVTEKGMTAMDHRIARNTEHILMLFRTVLPNKAVKVVVDQRADSHDALDI